MGSKIYIFGYSRKSTIPDIKLFDHIKSKSGKHLCTFIWSFCPSPLLPPMGFPPPLEQVHRANKIASQYLKDCSKWSFPNIGQEAKL